MKSDRPSLYTSLSLHCFHLYNINDAIVVIIDILRNIHNCDGII